MEQMKQQSKRPVVVGIGELYGIYFPLVKQQVVRLSILFTMLPV